MSWPSGLFDKTNLDLDRYYQAYYGQQQPQPAPNGEATETSNPAPVVPNTHAVPPPPGL
jgi:hypothetical protein